MTGDEALDARARAELPDFQYAAYQQGQRRARERHATRAEYAFMTEEEIEADIAARTPGGGPRDSDERAAAHAMRLALQREMGMEQPSLLSDAERDAEIGGS